MKTATHTILAKRRDTKFWQYAFIVSVCLFTAITVYREFVPKPQGDVLIVGPKGYHLAKLETFAEAEQLNQDQAQLAALFLLQRSPKGFDYADRLKLLLGEKAYKKAMDLVQKEQEEFMLKSLHQKVEIHQIKILNVRDKSVLASLQGQLIRTGNFDGKPFVEAMKLDAKITFVLNPDLIAKGNYPTIVSDFEIQTTPITSR